MTPPPDLTDKDGLIAALLARLEARDAVIVKLQARVAELEAKLNRPGKGPGNSSVPPSHGYKPSGPADQRPRANLIAVRTALCTPIPPAS